MLVPLGILALLSSAQGFRSTEQTLFTTNPTEGSASNFSGTTVAHAIGGTLITPDFSRYVDAVLEKSGIPGLSLAIVRGNEAVELGSWGRRTEDGDAMTDETLFHLASVSKAFLSTSMGILMNDFATGNNATALPPGLAEFTWKTKLKDILPDDWQLMDEWANKYSRYPVACVWASKMYTLGSYIIGLYSGKPYTEFVKDRIITPLNMSSTTYSLAAAKGQGKMTQAWTQTGRRIPQWLPDELMDLNAGPGGVISSAEDMAKWVSTLLNSGVNARTNVTVIPKSVLDDVTAAYAVAAWSFSPDTHSIAGYGMGWARYSYLDNEMVTHSGGIPGFSTLVTFSPTNNLGVVALANANSNAAALQNLTHTIFRQFSGAHPDIESLSAAYTEFIVPEVPHTSSTSTPVVAAASLAVDAYAGTYSNAGYGSFTLCAPSDTSHYCAQVAEDFSAVDAQLETATQRDRLQGAWPRYWSSHIRFTHHDADRFSVALPFLFPHGYGANTTAFAAYDEAVGVFADFVVEDGEVLGFGLFGLTGGETERERTERTVEARADVWFTKV
ncbi:hypothetical protein PLICRDRAFT_170107 [Plicaturopsis crispa FD-325 SS-3]|nr:hypothetical protein PLICRDRAFT_170107 [Plicaturopsis crispa FD-325 SS-3]